MDNSPSDPLPDDDTPEDRLAQEAEEYMRQGRYKDAVDRYGDLIRRSPTDLWSSLGHVSALECAGDVGAAQTALERLAQVHARNAHLQRFRRSFFERREEYSAAAQSREALAAATLDGEPDDLLAEFYFNQGRYRECLGELQRLQADGVDDSMRAGVQARLGACMRQLGELEEGRDHLIAALAIEPDNHWTLTELAEVERALGRPDEARAAYVRALAANPDDHWCRGHLAQLEFEQGDVAQAVHLYERVLEQKPDALWAKVELAQVLAATDADRARHLCQEVLDQDATFPWAYSQLAQLERDAGHLSAARDQFRQALETAPQALWIVHELADVCRQLGRYDEALTHLEHARNLDPFDASTYGFTAAVYRDQDDAKTALANLRKALEIDEGYVWAWRETAELCALTGDHDSARTAWQRACDLEPGVCFNPGLRAFLLRCQGRRAEAEVFLQDALEIDQTYAWAWRELIELQLQRGDLESAAAAHQRAVDKCPVDAPLALQAIEIAQRQNNREKVQELAASAVDAFPESDGAWACRAEAVLEAEPDVALRAARRAYRLAPRKRYLVLQARALLACQRPREALEMIAPLLELKPPPSQAIALAAKVFASNGHAADANRLLKLERRRRPEHVGIALHTIELASDVRLREEALRFLVAVRPAGVRWRDLLNPSLAIGESSLIRRVVGQIIANEPLSAMRSWMLSAEVALVLGDMAGATSAMRQAEHFDDGHPDLALLGVVLAYQNGDRDAVWRRVEKLGNVAEICAGDADQLVAPEELDEQRFAELLLSWLDFFPAPAIAALTPVLADTLGVAARRRIAVAQVQAGDRATGLATLRELANSDELQVAAAAQRDLVAALQEKDPAGALEAWRLWNNDAAPAYVALALRIPGEDGSAMVHEVLDRLETEDEKIAAEPWFRSALARLHLRQGFVVGDDEENNAEEREQEALVLADAALLVPEVGSLSATLAATTMLMHLADDQPAAALDAYARCPDVDADETPAQINDVEVASLRELELYRVVAESCAADAVHIGVLIGQSLLTTEPIASHPWWQLLLRAFAGDFVQSAFPSVVMWDDKQLAAALLTLAPLPASLRDVLQQRCRDCGFAATAACVVNQRQQ